MTVGELIKELEKVEDKSVEVVMQMEDIYDRVHTAPTKDIWKMGKEVWLCNFTGALD